MKDKLKKITDKSSNNKENSVLAKLLHKMLIELNLIKSITYLVDRYVRINKYDKTNVDRTITRSTMFNNITADEITWKTFIYILFNLLNIKELVLSIQITRKNNDSEEPVTTMHYVTVTKKSPVKDMDGMLAKLLKKVLVDLKLDDKDSRKKLLDEYIKSDKGIKKKTKSSMNGNINAKEITWSVFVDVIFNLLNVTKLRLVTDIKHASNRESQHEITVLKDLDNGK